MVKDEMLYEPSSKYKEVLLCSHARQLSLFPIDNSLDEVFHPHLSPDTDPSTFVPLTVSSMTNLDSILKSRDMTLPTKSSLVKAMIFPVVVCGCETLTLKKAKSRRTDAFNCGAGEDS